MSICAKFCLSLFLLLQWSSTGSSQEPHGQSGAIKELATEKKWFRGNLHTHSLWSDGNDFPEMIAKWYHDHDYHFLAMTDHNILSEGEKWMDVEVILERGSPDTIDKLQAAFGSQWIDRRTRREHRGTQEKTKGIEQIRLKTLAEFRQRFEKRGRFLMMTGEEISDSVAGLPLHMNATNLKTVIEPAGGETVVEAINNNLRIAYEQAKTNGSPILVHLNHPNFGWTVTAEDLAQVTMERFFEVYNGHPSINHLGDKDRPSVERIWDIANTIRIDQLQTKPLLGLATDDSHHYHGVRQSRSGRGWVMVRSSQLSPTKIIDAMYRGDYYCSSGVELSEITADQKQIALKIAAKKGATYTTQFIGTRKSYDRTTSKSAIIRNAKGDSMRVSRVYSDDVGCVLQTVEGNAASYKIQGDELYVRAVITSSADHPDPSFENQKQQAWTQPIVVK